MSATCRKHAASGSEHIDHRIEEQRVGKGCSRHAIFEMNPPPGHEYAAIVETDNRCRPYRMISTNVRTWYKLSDELAIKAESFIGMIGDRSNPHLSQTASVA